MNPAPDPYRWLEDPDSPRTQAWLAEQDALWRAHDLPAREWFRERLTRLADAGLVTAPVWRGGHRFDLRRSAGQEHPVLYRDGHAVLDPGALDPSGLTTLDHWQPSPDGRLLACQLSQRGDERAALHVVDLENGQRVDGPIDGCRYSPVAWRPDGSGFWYVRHRQVRAHRLGSPAADDLVLMPEPASYGLALSEDGRWLTVSARRGPGPGDLWLTDLATGIRRAVARDARAAGTVGGDGRLYVVTDHDAPRGRLCVADPESPAEWADLVPEDPDAVLAGFAVAHGRLLVSKVRHGVAALAVHDLETGAHVRDVTLPGPGVLGPLTTASWDAAEAWLTYSDRVTPPGLWRFDGRALTPETIGPTVTGLERRQITYRSKDGTPVRMLILAPPGTGPRPTLLCGYGGFGVPMSPAYAADSLAWVEAGGVLAVAAVRGGGEEGERWHRDGSRDRKQNAIDDFAAAAEHLIATGWTTADRLGAWGESNGGLLVAAAITQRPELFAAAVCSAPLTDMARYERSGLGPSWTAEYGSASDPEQLRWLLGYSPYHHAQTAKPYPATLFTVSASDTRVDPMHARKMCAAMRANGAAPVLLRVEPDTGHGARAISRSIALAADVLAFVARHTKLGV